MFKTMIKFTQIVLWQCSNLCEIDHIYLQYRSFKDNSKLANPKKKKKKKKPEQKQNFGIAFAIINIRNMSVA